MEKLRFAIVGYGRMGFKVKELLELDNESISNIIDPYKIKRGAKDWDANSLDNSDVAICFTWPSAGYETTKEVLSKGLDAVVGTTKFYLNEDKTKKKEMLAEFEELAKQNNCRMLYAPNLSIGMNTLYNVIGPLAKTLTGLEFDVGASEIHHTGKKDIAGTLIEIGEILLKNCPGKKRLNLGDNDRERDDDEITLSSIRVGDVPGTHEIYFDKGFEQISIKHTVRDPKVFAVEAIDAAYWLRNQEPGLYNIKDKFFQNFNNH